MAFYSLVSICYAILTPESRWIFAKPTAPMKKEAASAGVLDTPFGKFARLQILTIEDLFAGMIPAMSPEDPAAFRRAAREEDKTRQGELI